MTSGSGGLMQLVAYGAQDLFLTGNPTITHFKMVYRRYTNFAMEMIGLQFENSPNFTTTNITQSTVKIGRQADLLSDTYLVYDLPDIFSNEENDFKWVKFLGQNIIRTVDIHIDGQRLDMHYGQWMNIWNELVLTDEKKREYYRMIGNVPVLRPTVYAKDELHLAIHARRLYIPFEFWFCSNPGLAIPLIALQYQSIFITVEFNPLNQLFTIGSPAVSPEELFSDRTLSDSNLLLKERLECQGYGCHNLFHKYARRWNQNTFINANFIYLDTDERRLFAQTSHEYLIPQVQRNIFRGLKGGPNTLPMQFNHPVKELIWVFQRSFIDRRNDWNNYTRLVDPSDWKKIQSESERHFDSLEPDHDAFLSTIEVSDFIADIRAPLSSDGFTKPFDTHTNIMNTATFKLNGNDRFEPRHSIYFDTVQVYKYHTGAPNVEGINIYSFALFPERDQPSGSANFSRFDRAQFQTHLHTVKLNKKEEYNLFMYARSYNIFRIMAGMGNVVFAN